MIKITPKTGQRWLVYGLVLAGLAVFAWFQRTGNGFDPALRPSNGPGGRQIASAGPTPGSLPPGTVYYTGPMPKYRLTPGDASRGDRTSVWHEGNPTLQRPIDVQMTEATTSQVVTEIAKMTGLNLICFDAQFAGSTPGHLSLHLTHVPAWQAMQAVANACGGSWRQENTVYTLQIPESGRLPALRTKPMPMAVLAQPM